MAADDFATKYTETMESRRLELLARGLNRDALLRELSSIIRASRQALPAYKRIQVPHVYRMTLEDVEEHERALAAFRLNLNDTFDEVEIEDQILYARATGDIIHGVLQQGFSPHIQRSTYTKGSGCMVPLIVATSGLGALIAAAWFVV